MAGIVAEVENVPPSILYSTLKPLIAATVGKFMLVLQVLAIVARVGAAGKITTETVLLSPQIPVPEEFAAVVPQVEVNTYLAFTVWQPGVVGIVGVAENAPPLILYWAVKPFATGNVGNENAALQVFAGAVITGAEGNTVKTLEPGQVEPISVYVAV